MEGDLGWCRGGSSNNWDLHAVVRFACGAAEGPGAPSSPSDNSFPAWASTLQPQWPQQPLPTDPTVDDLRQAALLADHKAEPSSPRNEAPTTQQPMPPDEAPAKPRPSGRGGGGPTRSKRKSKKSQVNKEVTRVPAGAPSADPWAWRKYGQKPIKGSPYPRGYYRCSTDKDCKARKQVERCRADPATLIITYTGEHSHPVPLHRNSLAGTTRSKPQSASSRADEPQQAQSPPASESASAGLSPSPADTDKPQGSPSASTGLSPATPLRSPSVGVEYEDEEDSDTLAVRLLLEDTEMTAEDDALQLFIQPAPVPSSSGGGCDVAMLLPQPDEAAPAVGNGAGACDDVMIFLNKPNKEPGPGPVSGGGAEDVVLFPNPGEPQPTTVSANITNGGAGTASAINFADEKFSVSGLSAWEAAAASGWGW